MNQAKYKPPIGRRARVFIDAHGEILQVGDYVRQVDNPMSAVVRIDCISWDWNAGCLRMAGRIPISAHLAEAVSAYGYQIEKVIKHDD